MWFIRDRSGTEVGRKSEDYVALFSIRLAAEQLSSTVTCSLIMGPFMLAETGARLRN